MQLRGKVWKDGNAWLIQCPEIGAFTEGRRTKADAFRMMIDWIRVTLDRPELEVTIVADGDDEFVMAFEDVAPILGLMLASQRTAKGLTLQEVADAAGLKHRTAVNQAEAGTSELSLSRLARLFRPMGVSVELRVVPLVGATQAARKAPVAPSARRKADRRRR